MAGARLKKQVNSWHSANTFLGKRNERTIANNTVLRRIDFEHIGAYLHGCRIVMWSMDDSVTLSTCNYFTPTTKARINAFLKGTPWSVYQHRYEWFVHNSVTDDTYRFENNMVLPLGRRSYEYGVPGLRRNPTGHPIGPVPGRVGPGHIPSAISGQVPGLWAPGRADMGPRAGPQFGVPGRTTNPRYSRKAQEFISQEIEHLMEDKGYDQGRAIRTAHETARKKGYKVPPAPNPKGYPGPGKDYFTVSDAGCYIDGAFGEDHAVERMRELLSSVAEAYSVFPIGNAARELLIEEEETLEDEYRGEWLDDATENVLQEVTSDGAVWTWEAGDLCLVAEEDAEAFG